MPSITSITHLSGYFFKTGASNYLTIVALNEKLIHVMSRSVMEHFGRQVDSSEIAFCMVVRAKAEYVAFRVHTPVLAAERLYVMRFRVARAVGQANSLTAYLTFVLV